MNRPVLLLAPMLAAALVACSGGSDADEPSTIESAVIEPAVTSAPDETVAPTTSTTTTTTIAPTTTVDPLVEIEAAVKQARLDLEAKVLEVGMDPGNVALRAELRLYVTEERYSTFEEFFDGLVEEGLLVRPNEVTPAQVTFVSNVELPNGVDSSEAFVDACRVNSSVVYRPQSDGQDLVIDDTVTTTLTRIRMIREDERWLLESGVEVRTWNGVNTCVEA